MNKYNLPFFLKIDEGNLQFAHKLIQEQISSNSKILVITDDTIFTAYASVIIDRLRETFPSVEDRIISDNNISTSLQISEMLIEEDYNCVVGIGGGKVLDVSKYSSFISKRDYIAIPTAIAHDGVASPICVLTAKSGLTKSLGAKVPSGIIIDLAVIRDSPVELIKAGIGDILSNYTAIYDWKLADKSGIEKINDFAVLLSHVAFTSLFYFSNKDVNDIAFLRQVAESQILSGMAMEIAKTSHPCSGSEHLFSHSADVFLKKNNLHGLQVALGAIVSAYIQNRDYEDLIRFLKELDIDVTPVKLDFTKEEFRFCWQHGKETRPNRYTILDEVNLSDLEFDRIYELVDSKFTE